MSQLILITSLKNTLNEKELFRYIETLFTDHNVENVWVDPCGESRAVVLLDKKFENDFPNKLVRGTETEKPAYLDVARFTKSVFVNTFKTLAFGTPDKLKYLFTSQRHGGRKVLKVQAVNANQKDCFEIIFSCWDDVLKVCEKSLVVEKQELKAVPYFESFKEPYRQQLEKIQKRYELEEINRAAKKNLKAINVFAPQGKPTSNPLPLCKPNQMPLKPLPAQPSLAAKDDETIAASKSVVPVVTRSANDGFQGYKKPAKPPLEASASHHLPSVEPKRSQSSNEATSDSPTSSTILDNTKTSAMKQGEIFAGKNADVKSVQPYIEHHYIPMMLHFLHFDEVVQAQLGESQVTIKENTWEIKIIAPSAYLKIINKILSDEDEKSQPKSTEILLTLPTVQKELKRFIDSERMYVDIVEKKGKHWLLVNSGKENQSSLHDFISSLVVTKACHPLPSEQFQKHSLWTNFLKSFPSTYSYQILFVEDNSATLISLAHKSEDIDVILDVINCVIIKITNQENTTSAKTAVGAGKLSHENSSSSGSHISEDSMAAQIKTGPKPKEIMICPKHPLTLWFLSALHVREAAIDSNITVDIDEEEEEISLKGVDEAVQQLKGVLVGEDKKFPFEENVQEFLSDPSIKQDLTSVLRDLECHIVLDNNLQISIASKHGQQRSLWASITDVIKFTECSPLPKKHQDTKEWKNWIEDVQKNNQYHYIMTSDDKVYVMTFAANTESAKSFVVKVNNFISNLISPKHVGNKPTSVKASEQHVAPHQYLAKDGKMDQLDTTSRKTKPKEKVLLCQSSFLVWVLDALNIDGAVKKLKSGLTINIDVNDQEIKILGPVDQVEMLESVLLTEDQQIPFTEAEQEFLIVDASKKFLLKHFKECGIATAFNDRLEIIIVPHHIKKPFRAFLEASIRVSSGSPLPKKWQSSEEWIKFRDDFHQENVHHQIVCADDKVCLLTTEPNEDFKMEIFVKAVKKKISEFTSQEEDATSPDVTSYEGDIINRILHSCTGSEKEYCLQFLHKELDDIEAPYKKTYGASIRPVECGFEISSTSYSINNKMAEQLKQVLSTINGHEHQYWFPGLLNYLQSEGAHVIESLSKRYRCNIVPENKTNNTQQMLNEQQSSGISSYWYKTVVLETAKCSDFEVHLVQGDMQSFNFEMKIEIQPINTGSECYVKTKDTSTSMRLNLPPWSTKDQENSYLQFQKLRSSLHSSFSIALEQAKHLKCSTIALSTALLTEGTDSPFPADVIAKEFISSLFESFGSSSDSEREVLNFYIWEPKNEAVFKAFRFFMKLRNVSFYPQNLSDWDKDCFKENSICPDYCALFQSKDIPVEVLNSFPNYMNMDVCICYPIHSSLDLTTFPGKHEQNYSEYKFKLSLTELQHNNSDGILPCQIYLVNGFSDHRTAFVYCSPEWGMGYEKDLDVTLEKCFHKMSGFEKFYIIPPGLQPGFSCPVKHIAQTIFRKLDTYLQQSLIKKTKIYLLVEDKEHFKVFQEELQKRCPSLEEKPTFFQRITSNWWTKKDNKNKEENPKTVTWESDVQKTIITFWSTDQRAIQNAATNLQSHLEDLIKKNTETKDLDKIKALSFENHKRQIERIPVYIKYEKKYDMETDCNDKTKKGKKKGKKQKESSGKISLSGALLQVQGLIRSDVDKVLTLIHAQFDDSSSSRSLGGQSSQCDVSEQSDNKSGVNESKKCAKRQQEESDILASSEPPVKSEKTSQISEGTMVNKLGAQENAPSGTFEWLMESENDDFQNINKKDDNAIEKAYTEDKKTTGTKDITGKKVKSVNFCTMTATTENGEDRGIIRTEIIEEPPEKNQLPEFWKFMKTTRNSMAVTLEAHENEYQCCKEQLDLDEGKLKLVKIERLQNKKLYRCFKQKQQMLKNTQDSLMWHRVLNDCVDFVQKYGFHPRFSGMPKDSNFGDGVLFYDDPKRCLEPSDESGDKIYLVASHVLRGTIGPGKQGLRCPSDKQNKMPFDSVYKDGACMIFSDKQAYPAYLITLKSL